MPTPRDTAGMTLTDRYLVHVAEAVRLEQRVIDVRRAQRRRYLRTDVRRTDATLDKMVAEDPHVKAAIEENRFAREKAIMFGLGALLESLNELRYEIHP